MEALRDISPRPQIAPPKPQQHSSRTHARQPQLPQSPPPPSPIAGWSRLAKVSGLLDIVVVVVAELGVRAAAPRTRQIGRWRGPRAAMAGQARARAGALQRRLRGVGVPVAGSSGGSNFTELGALGAVIGIAVAATGCSGPAVRSAAAGLAAGAAQLGRWLAGARRVAGRARRCGAGGGVGALRAMRAVELRW
eukprot:366197-Chlamydomonas_euryale.AAC.5